MGEGVTNPVRGAASPSSAHSASQALLCADETCCPHWIFFVGLVCAFAAHWAINRLWLSSLESGDGGGVDTGLTRKKEPHLRRTEIVCGSSVSSLENGESPPLSASVDEYLLNNPPPWNMDSTSPPSQPDSFFTWDSGGSSGEYSFVHTAVELPKYPDGDISDEDKQMLLLYMQTGRPELLLTPSPKTPSQPDSLLCDPAAARGFLETIVEETSDDLRSPSECDEASVGWGSWDESDDEDRLTVVEMVTSANSSSEASTDPVYTSASMCDPLPSAHLHADPLISVSARQSDSDSDCQRNDQVSTVNREPRGVFDKDTKTPRQHSDDVLFGETEKSGNSDEGVSPPLDLFIASDNNSFDTLWITGSGLESPSDALNPWIVNRFLEPREDVPIDSSKSNFSGQLTKEDDSLLFLASDDICLVPSSPNISHDSKEDDDPETLMFSDNFKDYFLPSENYIPGFNKNDVADPNELANEVPLCDSPQRNAMMKCFRIGFEPTPTEQFSISHLDNSMVCDDTDPKSLDDSNDSDAEAAPKPECDLQDTMFSPAEGDVVYGSNWLSSRPMKEPEEISTGAEVHCSTVKTEVTTMLSESPPPDNSHGLLDQCASDDDTVQVPNSLSRWRHHTDLQHLQEGTSPIARWQHEHDLQNISTTESKQTESDESDDGLPPQLKEIYSSFKMKDNKMGRIRIKEDKNNNFKRLGLWDNESKVTLPPFNLNSPETGKMSPKQKTTTGASREELDDLDIEMFAVSKSSDNQKSVTNGDSDVDDALRSFNLLDEYTSEENSENETNYPVNFRDTTVNAEPEPDVLGDAVNDPHKPNAETHDSHNSLENPCSDNSDNCPLCRDPSFKSSRINDLFSVKDVEHDVQSLLQKTYPKMVGLSQTSPEATADPASKAADSMSPLTSSDSDGGSRKVKETKKRTKKRPKESTELKHDDSGYVEDDDDDDEEEEDSLGEKREKRRPLTLEMSRKSLSTAFYESKSIKPESSGYPVPESFQEFSKQLEQSLSGEEIKAGFLEQEKWNIPENLSQFSAWLLDKELKKISTREEMEKMFVDDIMSLREQTIAEFLKHSCSVEEKINLKSSDIIQDTKIQNSPDKPDLLTINKSNESLELNDSRSLISQENIEKSTNDSSPEFKNNSLVKAEYSDAPEWDFGSDEANNEDTVSDPIADEKILIDSQKFPLEVNPEVQIENQMSDDSSSSSKIKTDSDNDLSEEYYNYNFNKQVNKVFCESISDKAISSNPEPPLPDFESQQATSVLERNEIEPESDSVINDPTEKDTLRMAPVTERYEEECSSSNLLEGEKSAKDGDLSVSGSGTQIQPKVNDTTSDGVSPLTSESEGEASPELIRPQVTPPVDHQNSGLEWVNIVAPSRGEEETHSDGSERAADLMTPKGAFEGCEGEKEADAISSLDASVVRRREEEVSQSHVQAVSCHAHPSDGTASLVIEEQNSDGGATGRLCDNANVNTASEDVASEESGDKKVSAEFTTLDCCVKRSDVGERVVEPVAFEEKVSERQSLNILEEDLYISQSTGEGICQLADELIISDSEKDSIQPVEHVTECVEPDLISDCERAPQEAPVSETPCEKIEEPVFRAEYKRSSSLGREQQEEPAEEFGVQSKSTPDLRRCHEQPRSSAPLSALLSKSVSQRIQDYLGHSSRDERLLRSLPPAERSRHYRRICVSTETVVERAARFEARSQSSRRPAPRDESPFKIRSGSCPPSSMKHNSSWISKPTATVRPTIDLHRSKHSALKDDPKDSTDFMELITGYNKASRVTHKPPIPPSASTHAALKTARLKGSIASARRQFFEKISHAKELSCSTDSVQGGPASEEDDDPSPGVNRFDEFRRSARLERARLAASHPDLGALEAAVRSSKRRIDQLKKKRRPDSAPQSDPMPSESQELRLPYRRCTGEIAWASCAQRVREAGERRKQLQLQLEIVEDHRRVEVRAQGGAADEPQHSGGEFLGSRARSMDFLLDADNREMALPPENRLAGADRVKSEHELRIERSLQNLTLPDWYKQSRKPKEGFILRRGSEGSAGESRKRWQGLGSSRTPSATSLTATPTSYSQRNIVVPKRVTPTSDWRSLVSSRESLSPASLSPREGAPFHYTLSTSSLSRWSSSRLSTSSAPVTALSVHRSFRQPYLGWRAAAASSSGGASRSSPGITPLSATTPLQGSRPGSPRRGSQEHPPFAYGLQQNQITSAATLRPDGSESADTSRISPLALNTTNVFFSSGNAEDTFDAPPTTRFASVEMRRDRYSYTQSLYSGAVIVSPAEDDDARNYNLEDQPPPGRIWMESSFVGSKKDGSETAPNPRSIRIVPSDRSPRGGTCATQTAMGEYVLRDFRRFGITL
ncbi:uncharacterized protein CDAR_95222 [Caerostris darwini]|uniref:Uncharacterized protein n=1 Tax=Caerostris darwini TaxID=1538125 RepID=A0AAV4PMQ3_9ARAC|nr:uncharacterized protein CDAR_95222 [Caerostris darwini]